MPVLDVRQERARGLHLRLFLPASVETDASECLPSELFFGLVGRPTGCERVRAVERERRVRALADSLQEGVVVADLRAGQNLRGVESVEFGEHAVCGGLGVLAGDFGHEEPAGGHVGEGETVAVGVRTDHADEIPGVGVRGFEQGAGRHDAGNLSGVAVGGLVLVGHRDPVPPFDQLLEVRSEFVHWDPGHGVVRPVRRLLGDLQVEEVGDFLGVVTEELVEVPDLHHQIVGVGPGLEREELADDTPDLAVRSGHGDHLRATSERTES